MRPEQEILARQIQKLQENTKLQDKHRQVKTKQVKTREGRGGKLEKAGQGGGGQGNMGSGSSLPVTSQLTFIIHQIIIYQVIKSLLLGHGQSYLYGTVLDCK